MAPSCQQMFIRRFCESVSPPLEADVLCRDMARGPSCTQASLLLLPRDDFEQLRDIKCACTHPLVKSFKARKRSVSELVDLLACGDNDAAVQAAWAVQHLSHNWDEALYRQPN